MKEIKINKREAKKIFKENFASCADVRILINEKERLEKKINEDYSSVDYQLFLLLTERIDVMKFKERNANNSEMAVGY